MKQISLEEAKDLIAKFVPNNTIFEDLFLDAEKEDTHDDLKHIDPALRLKINPKTIQNPHLINGDGTYSIKKVNRKAKKVDKNKCWKHPSEDGDAFTFYVKTGTMHCYNDMCVLNEVQLNTFEMVVNLTEETMVDPRIVKDGKRSGFFIVKAIKYLLQRYKHVIGEYELVEQEEGELTPEQIKQRIRQASGEYYHWLLFNHPRRNEAWEYLRNVRGFKHIDKTRLVDMVTKYKIGFAFASWGNREKNIPQNINPLYNHLLKKGYTAEQMIEAGVVKPYKDGFRDVIMDSIVIPYFFAGRIINLYNRQMNPSDPKYKHNRLEGTVPYPVNWDVAKDYSWGMFIEGEFDWFTSVLLGFDNSITNRGTGGLSDDQIDFMVAHREETGNFKTIYLAFDPDGPGKTGIAKTGGRLVENGFNVRVMLLPSGSDPNELLVENGVLTLPLFEKLIEDAISYESYMCLYTVEKNKISTKTDLFETAKEIQPFVTKIPREIRGFLIIELIEAIKAKGIKFEDYYVDVLKQAWLGVDFEPAEKIKGFEEAKGRTWILFTDNKEHFEILKKERNFSNVLFVEEVASFIEQFMNSDLSRKIAIDCTMDKKIKDTIIKGINGDFKVFNAPSLDALKRINESEILDYIEKIENENAA